MEGAMATTRDQHCLEMSNLCMHIHFQLVFYFRVKRQRMMVGMLSNALRSVLFYLIIILQGCNSMDSVALLHACNIMGTLKYCINKYIVLLVLDFLDYYQYCR